MARRIIEQIMKLEKETKNTLRFETDNPKEDSLGVLYIRKSAFPGRPESIQVYVEID